MLPVAIVAFGSLGVTQGEDLAVVGLEIGLGNLFVAGTAGVDDLKLETLRVHPGDLVGAVAIVAHRQVVAINALAREVDTLAEGPVDALVTTPTGIRHIGPSHRGLRILAGQNGVGGMAIDAGRGHQQPALVQGLAVHTLLVVGHHALHCALVTLIRDTALAMAGPAQIGNVPHMGPRIGVVLLEDVVGPVAD